VDVANGRIDSTSDNARRLGLAALVVALVIAAYFFGRQTTGESEPNTEPGPTPAGVGPTEEINGVPVGYSQDEEGAVAAATNFARVMTGATGDRIEYRASLTTIAAPSWEKDAAKIADSTTDFILERYGDGATATFSPLRYKVGLCSSISCSVDLWGVLVATGSKLNHLDESWLTVSLDLEWVTDDWRVAGQASASGPTPELFEDVRSLDERSLNGFKGYEGAPTP
jgi:hypothetical protein